MKENFINLIQTIFSNKGFYLSISSGAVVPKFNPNYYNGRINIRITDKKKSQNIVEIEKEKYYVYQTDINYIKHISSNYFEKLLSISKNQKHDDYYGGFDKVSIKIDSVLISLDGKNIEEKDKILYKEFVNTIIGYFKYENRIKYYEKLYREKFNKDVVYNVANQKDIFEIIDECLEKNIDMEKYYNQTIKYERDADY